MTTRLLFLSLALAACTVGMVPRDLPPEPPPDPAPVTTGSSPTAGTGPAAPPVRRTYELDGNRLILPGPIVFAAGSADLDPASDPALEHAQAYLTDKDYISTLRVEGHADDQTLSERRAVAVARWLVAHGVDCKRLIAVGFGPNKPIADAGTPEGRAQNTRVELQNAALRGSPIAGAPLDGGGRVPGDDLCR